MKKHLLGALGAFAAVVALSSCSNEEPVPAPVNEPTSALPSVTTDGELQTVSFDGTIPSGVRSRGIADYAGNSYHLTAAIYDIGGNLVLSQEYNNVDATKNFSVKLNLAKDGKYRAVFIAQVTSGTIWDVNLEAKKLALKSTQYSVSWRAKDDLPLFIWDDPVTIDPAVQTSYSVVLKRPLAEVVLISNQMSSPAVAAIFKSGTKVAFGSNAKSKGYQTAEMPKGYNFWNGTAEGTATGNPVDASEFASLSLPGYDGYTVLCKGQFFVNRGEGSEYDVSFGLAPKDGSASAIGHDLGKTTFKRNSRYVYVDNGGGGGQEPGGDNPGGLFNVVTSFSMDINTDYDDDNDVNL